MPSTDPYPISALTADETTAFVHALSRAFGDTSDDEAVAHLVEQELQDPSLSLVARDRERIVGTTTVLDFTMTVPGAPPVVCAGVTSVSVQPTHRRRGVLTSLMRRQLDDLHASGTAWAALYATESAIYGRYGYGLASRSLQLALDGPWTTFTRPPAPAPIELLEAADAVPRVAALYQRVRATTPGMMSMDERAWRLYLGWDRPGDRNGASARQVAMIDDRAFAVYRLRRRWSDTGPDGTVDVDHCMAVDADAYRQLWAYLLGIDLVQHMSSHLRPVDEPLPWFLAERRRLHMSEGMACYVRLVDIAGALSQRGTTGTGAVVLDVSDAFCPWNARCWRLEGDGATLRCERTDAPADVTLDARELASLSLGGVTPFELERAGLVVAHTPGALARLAGLLAAQRPPWNPFIF